MERSRPDRSATVTVSDSPVGTDRGYRILSEPMIQPIICVADRTAKPHSPNTLD